MIGGRVEERPVLVVHDSVKARKTLTRILSAIERPILSAEGIDGGTAHLAKGPELLFMSHGLFLSEAGQKFLEAAEKSGAESCVILGGPPNRDEMSRLFQYTAFSNLLMDEEPVLLADGVVITALKLLRGDIFGLEKYLSWGVDKTRRTLKRSDQRREIVSQLHEQMLSLGLGRRIASMAAHVSDELMSNAVFHAAVDEGGKSVRSDAPRTDVFELSGRDEAELAYACDGRFLALSVTDRYGSLRRKTILDSLARSTGSNMNPRPGPGGAGLGLALVLGYVTHLVFNLEEGKRTEVVALFDLRRDIPAGAPPSVNIFERHRKGTEQ
jgi:anti-sigma regulatory factor (Ser/Thr protein kinase)